MLKKCTTLFLLLSIILPIIEAYYNGYDSYKEYYKNYVNGVYSVSSKMAEQPNYKEKNVQKVVKYIEGFVFPDDYRLRTRNGGRSYVKTKIDETAPRCDNGQLFCENVQNYPREFVNQILKKNSDLYVYAFKDAVPIDSRLDLEDVKELCPSTGHDIIPEAAKSMNGEWMLIVQSKEMNFQQRIHIETCQEQDSKCQIINDKLPEGYFPRCKQKYIYRQLLAIKDNVKTVHESFPFPATCCCHLYFHTN